MSFSSTLMSTSIRSSAESLLSCRFRLSAPSSLPSSVLSSVSGGSIAGIRMTIPSRDLLRIILKVCVLIFGRTSFSEEVLVSILALVGIDLLRLDDLGTMSLGTSFGRVFSG
uniref:(northern house mosquito) hypothetical protein n=1 Tax=Culex pipiens TaxID=7175 RepID=A0A8D8AAQ8_CULPI